MMREMPVDRDYRALPGRNNVNILDDGSATRIKIDLFPEYIRNMPAQKRELWDVVGRALCSNLHAIALDRGLVPDDAVARAVRNDRLAVDDLQRLLHHLVGPIDVFEEMRGRRHREQMRACLGIKMR